VTGPRVLHVITGLAAGGAEQQLRLLLRHLPGEHTVATLTNAGAVAAAIRAEGTAVFDLAMRDNRDTSVVPRLARLIRAGEYDIVHTHLYRACVYGRIAALLAGVPHVVATEHSLGDTLIEGRRITAGVRALYLATERLGDATVAVSDTTARRLTDWGVSPERIAVIPNGIEAAEFRYDPALRAATRERLGIPERRYVVGAVGRLEPTKRFDVLVEAVAEVEDATLLLVGEGSERSALEALAASRGLADRTVFTGEAADVPALLCAMDVFAAPSPEETFGLAVLEALAAGLPVVYVACPALDDLPAGAAPDAVRVPLDPAAFRNALAAGLYEAEAAGGPRRLDPPPAVGHYDIEALSGRLGDLYEQVMAGRTPAPPPRVIARAVPVPADALPPPDPPAPATAGARPGGSTDQGSAEELIPEATNEGTTMARPAEILRRLMRRGGLLALTVLLGVAGGAAYGMLTAPSYTASAYVVAVPQTQGGDDTTAVSFAQAFGRIATQAAVLDRAAATGVAGTADTLRSSVQVSTSPDAPVVQLTGTAGDAEQAAAAANAVADALIDYGNERRNQTRVTLGLFAAAAPPSGPSSPNLPLDVAVGAAAGLLVGGLAVMGGVGQRPPAPAPAPAAPPVPPAGPPAGPPVPYPGGTADRRERGGARRTAAAEAEPAPGGGVALSGAGQLAAPQAGRENGRLPRRGGDGDPR
jgi:glycosyltransferase involved in cell wall biosynthesis/capsular polysaccharide biosynthesis protein